VTTATIAITAVVLMAAVMTAAAVTMNVMAAVAAMATAMAAARQQRQHCDPKRTNADNELLLIYPLDVEETELSAAASGLKELGEDLLGWDQANARSVQGQLDKGNTAKRTKKPKRTHYVTIQDNDKERLCPGQWFNNALVEFWMLW
jgi:hypothetical protein